MPLKPLPLCVSARTSILSGPLLTVPIMVIMRPRHKAAAGTRQEPPES